MRFASTERWKLYDFKDDAYVLDGTPFKRSSTMRWAGAVSEGKAEPWRLHGLDFLMPRSGATSWGE